MAATATIDALPGGREVSGASRVHRGKITVGTYATNGVAVSNLTFELPVRMDDLTVRASAGYVPEWDKTNGKIIVYDQKDPGAVGGADIALPEVGNAVDLAAVFFRFEAKGR